MKKVYYFKALVFLMSVFLMPKDLAGQCQCTGSCASGIQDVNQSNSGEFFCAVSYLCPAGVLDEDDGFFEPGEYIIRQDVAKTIYIGLFGSATMASVTDSFSTPFADLQGNWIEYYKYAKAMSYLEYGDSISVFDRVFYNFRPGEG